MKPPIDSSECVIPTRPPTEVLRTYGLESSPHEERDISEYVEWQLSKGAEKSAVVEHLEPVKSEVVWARIHKVWDVHTTDGRWWVVTEPMNLYSQEHFPSLDYMLSLHVGLMAAWGRVTPAAQRTTTLSALLPHGAGGNKQPRQSTVLRKLKTSRPLE